MDILLYFLLNTFFPNVFPYIKDMKVFSNLTSNLLK